MTDTVPIDLSERAKSAEHKRIAKLVEAGLLDEAHKAIETILFAQQDDSALFGMWGTELGDLSIEPEREVWLLRDQITGKPALPIGRATMFSAAGGTGKTTSLVQLAIAVPLDETWCGFKSEHGGCVALCCGESDRRLMKRHLWRAMNSYGLAADQRERVMSQVHVSALAGKQINMLRGCAGNEVQRTEYLTRFRDHLEKLATDGNFDWSLIILDPLSRFAGPDTESNNSAATQFAQAVETLCELPGNPSVICAHHSSKASIVAGRNDSRGVSGLRDAFRAVMVMTRVCVETIVGVYLECDKSNEAPYFEPRWLVQQSGNELGGTLRPATEPEAAMLDEATVSKKKKATVVIPVDKDKPSARDALLAALKKADGFARSASWLADHTAGFRRSELFEEIKLLIIDQLVDRDESGKTKGAIRLINHSSQLEIIGSQNLGTGDGTR